MAYNQQYPFAFGTDISPPPTKVMVMSPLHQQLIDFDNLMVGVGELLMKPLTQLKE